MNSGMWVTGYKYPRASTISLSFVVLTSYRIRIAHGKPGKGDITETKLYSLYETLFDHLIPRLTTLEREVIILLKNDWKFNLV